MSKPRNYEPPVSKGEDVYSRWPVGIKGTVPIWVVAQKEWKDVETWYKEGARSGMWVDMRSGDMVSSVELEELGEAWWLSLVLVRGKHADSGLKLVPAVYRAPVRPCFCPKSRGGSPATFGAARGLYPCPLPPSR